MNSGGESREYERVVLNIYFDFIFSLYEKHVSCCFFLHVKISGEVFTVHVKMSGEAET